MSIALRALASIVLIAPMWHDATKLVASEKTDIFHRPVAVAFDANSQCLFVANGNTGTITSLNLATGKVIESPKLGNAVKDLVIHPRGDSLTALVDTPHSAVNISLRTDTWSVESSFSLNVVPERIALAFDGEMACVTDVWNSQVEVLSIDRGRFRSLDTQALPWMPKEVIAIRDGFVIADAFDGSVAVLSPSRKIPPNFYSFRGHHIGGLAVDQENSNLLVTHQILSKTSHTTRDDIHWGSLMQNVVRSIPIAALSEANSNLDRVSRLFMLGDTGSGESDPAGVIVDGDHLLVAASGANHLVRIAMGTQFKTVIETAIHPTRLVRIDTRRIAVMGTLSDTIDIVNLDSLSLESRFGGRSTAANLELLGEIAFHNANLSHDRWMSCSSCHVNGHAAQALADTQGDASFQSPKRTPSLLSNAFTAPFGWTGNKPSMDSQLRQTLETTMHTPLDETSKAEAIEQLKAYLRTLRLPELPQREPIEPEARQLFIARGCAECHRPDHAWTSPNVFDVGVVDEVGHRKFNPPSLLGLRFRKRFFHDARYKSLSEVLSEHPDPKSTWTEKELQLIQHYLHNLPLETPQVP
jgi:hypothetical protein